MYITNINSGGWVCFPSPEIEFSQPQLKSSPPCMELECWTTWWPFSLTFGIVHISVIVKCLCRHIMEGDTYNIGDEKSWRHTHTCTHTESLWHWKLHEIWVMSVSEFHWKVDEKYVAWVDEEMSQSLSQRRSHTWPLQQAPHTQLVGTIWYYMR